MIVRKVFAPHFRLLIALIAAVICVHALPALPTSLQTDDGPAFSAGSAEVALPARHDLSMEIRILPAPDPRAGLEAGWQSDNNRLVASPFFWPVPHSQGPPPRNAREPQSLSRAPPLS